MVPSAAGTATSLSDDRGSRVQSSPRLLLRYLEMQFADDRRRNLQQQPEEIDSDSWCLVAFRTKVNGMATR
jgi:hypothetical protein